MVKIVFKTTILSLLLLLISACGDLQDPPPQSSKSSSLTPVSSSRGIEWPSNRIFPIFPAARSLDVVQRESIDSNLLTAIASLQGLVNRSEPRIYIMENSEPSRLWLREMEVPTNSTNDHYGLIAKYRNEIRGLIIYDESQIDTVNLATTMAGQMDGLVVSPNVASRLTSAPYSLPILQDLRNNHFRNRLEVYQYQFDHYTSNGSHRIIFGLTPAILGHLRDYAVATKGIMVWLNPKVPAERALLDRYFGLMALNSPYLGWWPDEADGVSAAARFGIPVYAADWSSSLSALAGKQVDLQAPPAPAAPVLEKKLYVAVFMSDGDNLQEDQGLVPLKWMDGNRGKTPVGWTLNPALVDVAPLILKYFQKTATPNDVLLSGPSGLGYTYPAIWPKGKFKEYAKVSGEYMRRAGFSMITVWNNGNDLKAEDARSYLDSIPNLEGMTIQDESRELQMLSDQVPLQRLTISYGDTEAILARGIDDKLRNFTGRSAEFAAVQGNMNMGTIHPTAFLNLQRRYAGNSNVVFVRPDHFFNLIRQKLRPGVKPPPVIPPVKPVTNPQVSPFIQGDFNGDGTIDQAYRNDANGDWWVGAQTNDKMDWHLAGNTVSMGPLSDDQHDLLTGDFNGDRKADILVIDHRKNDWSVGVSNGRNFDWHSAAQTSNFGNFRDGQHKIMLGDFNGDRKTDVLFYYSGDHNWWLGLSDGNRFNWQLASNTKGYQSLLDGHHLLYIGDFNGDQKSDVLMYFHTDGNWWMGTSNGKGLEWHFAGNTSGFGDLMESSHAIHQGDINGDGRVDMLFTYNGDGNIWAGISDGNSLQWSLAGNASHLGPLADSNHRVIFADFNADRRADLLVYSTDGQLTLGTSRGQAFDFNQAGNISGFGSLLDSSRILFSGDYNADGKTDLLFYFKGDGNWWRAHSDGQSFRWYVTANTQGMGIF